MKDVWLNGHRKPLSKAKSLVPVFDTGEESYSSTNSYEPSARERPVRGFIPPLMLSLFGYRLRIGHRGESERHGCSRTRFPVRNRILSVTLLF